MQHEAGPSSGEVQRLQQELEWEREGAQQLRRALELAAAYFQVPGGDSAAEAAWIEIVQAIRSEAGRSGEYDQTDSPGENEEVTGESSIVGNGRIGRSHPAGDPGDGGALPSGPARQPRERWC